MQILEFYTRMGMALPQKPPLMLVDSAALNDAEATEQRRPEPGGKAAPAAKYDHACQGVSGYQICAHLAGLALSCTHATPIWAMWCMSVCLYFTALLELRWGCAQEYREIRTVRRMPGGAFPFQTIIPKTVRVEGPTHQEVL